MLLNGWTLNASAYVTMPSAEFGSGSGKNEIGSDATGIHERDLRTIRLGRPQLRISDHVAEHLIPRLDLQLPADEGTRRISPVIVPTASLPIGRASAFHLLMNGGDCRIRRDLSLDDRVVDGSAEIAAHISGSLVEDEIEFGYHATERECAGYKSGISGRIRQHTIVGQMSMTCDHHVDCRIERAVDRNDRSTDADAGVDGARRRCLGSAFVQEHDNGSNTLILQYWDKSVSCLGFIEETPALDTGLSDERVSVFEGHTDEGNLHTSEFLNPIGWQCSLSRFIVDHICSQPLEIGARIRSIGEVSNRPQGDNHRFACGAVR